MFAYCALLLLICVCSVAGKIDPATVTSLDVSKYLGLWYQMYADKIVISTFEKDSYCCTALYGVGPDNSITVHNYAKIGNPVNGTNYVINGFATQDNLPTYPGQLKVKFTDGGAPFPAPYWILALGPVNQNNLYDWAIVSDNLSAFLFVLARDVKTFQEKYESQVLAQLDSLGFNGFTKPIPTYQGSDCVYESQ